MTIWSHIVKSPRFLDNSPMPEQPDRPPSGNAPPPGRRARRALVVRQALFDAGFALFERQPVGLVSVLDITEKADVAKGVFYLHFHSKDEYLLQLWAEAHRRFLERAQIAAQSCRSNPARLSAVVRELVAFSRNAPAASRFWMRMLGYFPDEIGPPGALAEVRRAYTLHLAALLAGVPAERVANRDVQTASLMDSLCWSILNAEALDGRWLDTESIIKAISSVVRSTGVSTIGGP